MIKGIPGVKGELGDLGRPGMTIGEKELEQHSVSL